jgi:3'-phosphoadenosine 5'-phosphosulfate sulfotransferase (PAPS reductase)/FAD synthetase
MKNKVIGWWSGGVTSAVTCKLCIDLYGLENVRLIFIDTFNEDEDTYRFKKDCEKWYGKEIETITRIGKDKKYQKIQDVWYKYKSLNVATGAVCSSELKRELRKEWEKENEYKHQAFGFDVDEIRRVKSMTKNYRKTAKPIFPLLMFGYTKKDCVEMILEDGLKLPNAYVLGFLNNNCLNTGCVSGGIGYWQKMERDIPNNFDKMAEVEHDLTDMKGEPVTMLKDQSKAAKKIVEETGDKTRAFVFLKPHPKYPSIKDISMMEGREPQPLMDCNGLACGVTDLDDRNPTEKEINYQTNIFNFNEFE